LGCRGAGRSRSIAFVRDEETHEATDRLYWENRGSKSTVAMADELLEVLRTFNSHLELKYNKFYIGLAIDGQPNNFVTFRAQKNAIRVEPRLQKTEVVETAVEQAGLDMLDYDNKWGRYRIRLYKGNVDKHAAVLLQLLEAAYKESGGGDA
jgi:hypothetical protein